MCGTFDLTDAGGEVRLDACKGGDMETTLVNPLRGLGNGSVAAYVVGNGRGGQQGGGTVGRWMGAREECRGGLTREGAGAVQRYSSAAVQASQALGWWAVGGGRLHKSAPIACEANEAAHVPNLWTRRLPAVALILPPSEGSR